MFIMFYLLIQRCLLSNVMLHKKTRKKHTIYIQSIFICIRNIYLVRERYTFLFYLIFYWTKNIFLTFSFNEKLFIYELNFRFYGFLYNQNELNRFLSKFLIKFPYFEMYSTTQIIFLLDWIFNLQLLFFFLIYVCWLFLLILFF